MLLEESAESRRVGEVEQVGDLLNALVGVVHEEYATSDDGPKDMLLYGKSRHRLRYCGEIFWR